MDRCTDFDHSDPAYAADPFTIWDDLRVNCPVARPPRFRGMGIPSRHAGIGGWARHRDELVAQPLVTGQVRGPRTLAIASDGRVHVAPGHARTCCPHQIAAGG
jgi:hypothetical protein